MAQNADFLLGQQPLSGVILCCTSVPQDVRTHLAGMAAEMGAVHKLDLTSDVTHLIVGSIATPKYRYVARERPDIKVLLTSWLEETRTLWMAGADVDLVALESKHRCPPFFGLQICLTGFDELEQRTYISSSVTEQGATYHGDLTKAVTHLIAAAPQGQKYTHAKKWDITVVSLKWFEDSLQRGMAADETFYDPGLPLEEQGKGAFKRQRTSLGKHGREENTANIGNQDLARKRLRRTASTRLESQSQDLWHDMSVEPVKKDDVDNDSWKDDQSHTSADTAAAFSHRDFTTDLNRAREAASVGESTDGLFCGHKILIHGFDRRRTLHLEQVLRVNGAAVAHTVTALEDASDKSLTQIRGLLVPHNASERNGDFPKVSASTSLVTEWWVERCLFHKRLLDPATDALSRPLGDSQAAGFKSLLISTTGFSGIDLRQVAQTVVLMGGMYQEKVLPSSSVIVCSSSDIKKEKAFYARKHHIPAVSADWLWACLAAKHVVPYDAFKLKMPAFETGHVQGNRVGSGSESNAPHEGEKEHVKTRSRGSEKDGYKRLSNARTRQITPSLALHATKVATNTTTSRGKALFYEDDDEPDGAQTRFVADQAPDLLAAGQGQPHALREVSPNLSPAKRNSQGAQQMIGPCSDRDEQLLRPISASKVQAQSERDVSPRTTESNIPGAEPPTVRTHVELTADLAELLNKTGSSRPSSTAAGEVPQRRKARPLGRASSNTSARSISASAPAQRQDPQNFAAETDIDKPDGLNAGQNTRPPPSTQLGYETPDTQAHRLQMSKKMGTKLYDEPDGRRVPSLGVIKDTSLMADAGVGNRVKGRGRAK